MYFILIQKKKKKKWNIAGAQYEDAYMEGVAQCQFPEFSDYISPQLSWSMKGSRELHFVDLSQIETLDILDKGHPANDLVGNQCFLITGPDWKLSLVYSSNPQMSRWIEELRLWLESHVAATQSHDSEHDQKIFSTTSSKSSDIEQSQAHAFNRFNPIENECFVGEVTEGQNSKEMCVVVGCKRPEAQEGYCSRHAIFDRHTNQTINYPEFTNSDHSINEHKDIQEGSQYADAQMSSRQRVKNLPPPKKNNT